MTVKLTMGEPRKSGRWIDPAERGAIYGWDLFVNGESFATVTADDMDLAEKLSLSRQIITAFNLRQTLMELASEKS